ncbi:hypothetical protein, partial [Helicobacter burdigaliensis]|uniref:hypothetical protein n=1 Tax=Helicobacter burdigaliensis TaxID=2315334 RepID=UPI001E481F81
KAFVWWFNKSLLSVTARGCKTSWQSKCFTFKGCSLDLHYTSFVDSLTCMLRHNVPRNDKVNNKTLYKKYFESGLGKLLLIKARAPTATNKIAFCIK